MQSPQVSSPAGRSLPWLLRLLTGTAVLGLGLLAGWQGLAVWERLPSAQLARLRTQHPGNELPRRFSEALQAAPLRVREAVSLTNLSHRFTTALFVPETLTVGRDQIATNIARHRHTDLGRLHMAAFAMLEREQGGARLEDGWNILSRYLEMVDPETAQFAHLEAELIQQAADFYRDMGVSPGAAQMEGLRQGANAHGPFGEYLTDRLERLAQARQAAGDRAAAQQCRTIARSLLRQWVLAPASPGLRLMAAERLTELLDADVGAGGEEQAVAQALRAWRAAYHAGIGDGRFRVPQLAPGLDAQPVRAQHDLLASWLAWLVWQTTFVASALLVTVVMLPAWLLERTDRPPGGPWLILAVVVVVGVRGLFTLLNTEGGLVADLRHDFSPELGWPRSVLLLGLISAGAWAGLAMWACWPVRTWRAGAARLARVALTVSALAAAQLLIGAWQVEKARVDYDTAVAAALAPEHAVRAVVGASVDDGLRVVREWRP